MAIFIVQFCAAAVGFVIFHTLSLRMLEAWQRHREAWQARSRTADLQAHRAAAIQDFYEREAANRRSRYPGR